ITNVSNAKKLFLKIVDLKNQRPLTRFAAYYLMGRESVASKALADHSAEIEERLLEGTLSKDERDIRLFWLIVGLLESGALENARGRIKAFRPSDPRLLLAIHMGCFLIQHHRIADRAEKKIAREICESLTTFVRNLRRQLLFEFKSELLELRRGEIQAINVPSTAEEEAKLLELNDDDILAVANEVADQGFKLLDEMEEHGSAEAR